MGNKGWEIHTGAVGQRAPKQSTTAYRCPEGPLAGHEEASARLAQVALWELLGTTAEGESSGAAVWCQMWVMGQPPVAPLEAGLPKRGCEPPDPPPSGRGPPPPVWGVRLDAPGQRRGQR